MVGAPASYSGHHPYPPTTTPGTNYLPNQAYASPRALLSTLLPYDGRGAPNPWGPPTSSEPINTSYLYPPSNPTSSPFPTSAPYPLTSSAPPPPFPPFSTAQANPYNPSQGNTSIAYPQANYQQSQAYPRAGFPPQHNSTQAPTGYPGGQQPSGNYTPPTYASYPPTSGYPYTHQAPPYGAGNYPAPPHAGGGSLYPPRQY